MSCRRMRSGQKNVCVRALGGSRTLRTFVSLTAQLEVYTKGEEKVDIMYIRLLHFEISR